MTLSWNDLVSFMSHKSNGGGNGGKVGANDGVRGTESPGIDCVRSASLCIVHTRPDQLSVFKFHLLGAVCVTDRPAMKVGGCGVISGLSLVHPASCLASQCPWYGQGGNFTPL